MSNTWERLKRFLRENTYYKLQYVLDATTYYTNYGMNTVSLATTLVLPLYDQIRYYYRRTTVFRF
jgi:hypothetical protein